MFLVDTEMYSMYSFCILCVFYVYSICILCILCTYVGTHAACMAYMDEDLESRGYRCLQILGIQVTFIVGSKSGLVLA